MGIMEYFSRAVSRGARYMKPYNGGTAVDQGRGNGLPSIEGK
jgi:hypothetical protein